MTICAKHSTILLRFIPGVAKKANLFMSIKERVSSPSDVKKLNVKELKELAGELRGEIISVVNENGGHLSSNLGIVETTLALYHTFDFPKDKLVFDVGHQCYAHKILSGRGDKFDGIRTSGGLSGFPDAEESEFDPFTTGHAGTSIASGLGLCAARDKAGEDYFVINVVGDGSLVNGLNLEAIASSDVKPKNYIVILNDNGMSISKNGNAFYRILSKSTTRRGYIKSKHLIKKVFGNSFITRFFKGIRDFFKRLFGGDVWFEKFGFKYVGVCDGNDMKELTEILESVKRVARDKAVFLHIKTTKGKGHKGAEERSDLYHGVGKNLRCSDGCFSSALGDALNAEIEKDDKIVAITAAMKDGTGLSRVEKAHPANFYDVGIAEEYAVTFAAGLAKGGAKPVVAIYSTFMQRAYDEIMHDVCLQNLPIVFCLDRAGLVGEDGKTHQGVFDFSYLTHLPNITVLAPDGENDLKAALSYALSAGCPVAIRYPKDSAAVSEENLSYSESLWREVKPGEDFAVFAAGPRMAINALAAAERIEKDSGKHVAVYSARTVKPLDITVLEKFRGKKVLTVEENAASGGFGAEVASYYAADGKTRVYIKGVPDEFIPHGSVKEQLDYCGLSEEGIYSAVKENL